MGDMEQLGSALTGETVAILIAAAALAYFVIVQFLSRLSDRRERARERAEAAEFARTLQLARHADEQSHN